MLIWKKASTASPTKNAVYADAAGFRFVVERHYNKKWELRVYKTVLVAGLPTRGDLVEYHDFHDTKALAKAVAEAYAVTTPGGTLNRLTRANIRAYESA